MTNSVTEQDLIIKYPILKQYIIQCFREDKVEELMEFLDGLQLDDQEVSQ